MFSIYTKKHEGWHRRAVSRIKTLQEAATKLYAGDFHFIGTEFMAKAVYAKKTTTNFSFISPVYVSAKKKTFYLFSHNPIYKEVTNVS